MSRVDPNVVSFNRQQPRIHNHLHPLSLHLDHSTGHAECNEFPIVDKRQNRPDFHAFHPPAPLDQSNPEKDEDRDQIEYGDCSGDSETFPSFKKFDAITGLYDPHQIHHAFNNPDPYEGPYYENGPPTGINCFHENPAFFIPPLRIVADSLGWPMRTGLATTLNTATNPHAFPEGQPMNCMPTRQPDIRALPNHTRSMTLQPIAAVSPKRSAKRRGKFPCPVEDCSTSFSRSYDIRRHIADKHADHTLLCPVDGCTKRYARRDKRLDHLVKGHKLGPQAINLLIEAKLAG